MTAGLADLRSRTERTARDDAPVYAERATSQNLVQLFTIWAERVFRLVRYLCARRVQPEASSGNGQDQPRRRQISFRDVQQLRVQSAGVDDLHTPGRTLGYSLYGTQR